MLKKGELQANRINIVIKKSNSFFFTVFLQLKSINLIRYYQKY